VQGGRVYLCAERGETLGSCVLKPSTISCQDNVISLVFL
jgi:hypothetical protein